MSSLKKKMPIFTKPIKIHPNRETKRKPIVTIDDVQRKAQELLEDLIELGTYKHPLKVRKGNRKEVIGVSENADRSQTLKAGSKTYFFDIKETKEGKPYLVITESRYKGEDEEQERNSLFVFPESAQEFAFVTTTMLSKIIQT